MPRDYTALAPGIPRCIVPFGQKVSHIMTQKKKEKKAYLERMNKAYAKRQKNGTIGPVQMIGSVAGGIGGMMLGGPLGAAIGSSAGSALGNGIGYVLGSGDYKVQNNACLVPGFNKNNDSTIVTHREYITDIKSGPTIPAGTSSTAFDITEYALNPGVSSTFPWLASIAANYEEYDILGMVFAYVATSGESVASTSTALGSVIMATEYDPTKPAFVNKQAMENYSFATSAKPSVSQMHAIECAKIRTPVKQLYVRSGANTGTDLRWTDFGNFYIATVGYPAVAVTLGELWVTYKVKLIKPRLPITVSLGGQLATGVITRASCSTSQPFGTSTLRVSGPIVIEPVVGVPSQFRFKAIPNMDYLVMCSLYGASVGPINVLTFTNGFIKPFWRAGTNNYAFADNATTAISAARVECSNADTDGYIIVTLGFVTSSASLDVLITQVDESIN